MQRKSVILLLCAGVFVFSAHNIYQSSSIARLTWEADSSPFARQVAPHAVPPILPIEIIADGLGSNLSELLLSSDVNKYYPSVERNNPQPLHGFRSDNRPRLRDSIPGRRRRASRTKELFDEEGRDGSRDRAADEDDDFPSFAEDGRCNVSASDVVYKDVNGTRIAVPLWQRRLDACRSLGRPVNGTWRYALAELLQVRLYAEDRARWTIRELKQWMHFMLLAGVEHIFVCDHFQRPSERLDDLLDRYIAAGLVTYIPWPDIPNPMQAQIRCYQHIIDNYRQHTSWQIAVDMDEYPFSPSDAGEGFLVRYLRRLAARYGPRISEVSIANFLMLGQGDRRRDVVVDRINRMTPTPANQLAKPIFRPERVRANVHHNRILYGTRLTADSSELRMLHYWGARVQDWGPDTNRTLAITVEMNAMRQLWAARVRSSLLAFGEFDAFSNQTGP